MASKLWYGPIWPLPRPSPRTCILSGLAGFAAGTEQGSSEYEEAVAKNIRLSCAKTNTNMVYLVIKDASGNFDKDNDGTVILAVQPGDSKMISEAEYGGNRYRMSDIGIDTDNDYNNYWISALME